MLAYNRVFCFFILINFFVCIGSGSKGSFFLELALKNKPLTIVSFLFTLQTVRVWWYKRKSKNLQEELDKIKAYAEVYRKQNKNKDPEEGNSNKVIVKKKEEIVIVVPNDQKSLFSGLLSCVFGNKKGKMPIQ
jgi:hypothetical protein